MEVREPAGPIQRAPQGLLSFFDLKGQASNPNALYSGIMPTFDLEKWFLNRPPVSSFGTLPIIADVSNDFATVNTDSPEEGTCWLIRNVTATVQVMGGQTLHNLRIMRSRKTVPAGGFVEDVTDHAPGVVAIPVLGPTAFVTASCNKPLLILPQERFGINLAFSFAALNTSATLNITAYVLRL